MIRRLLPDSHHNKLALYSSHFTIYHKSLVNLQVTVGEYTLIKYTEIASEKEVDIGHNMKEGKSLKTTAFLYDALLLTLSEVLHKVTFS